ncbi:zinc-binding dehydrogenase [Streptomyces pseudogriseolus]|uniref:zinc-binding dehydrogenase n=1 Tax=Streptomyces pseudogriseolus TaxID=36817 RepID=UPI00346A19AD|nr:zinc-binding dehydrogenase [Streptomyces pseudogriseolus]
MRPQPFTPRRRVRPGWPPGRGGAIARFARTRRDLYGRHSEELWDYALSGRLRAVVHARVPLTEAARAHEIIKARADLGKVVLVPWDHLGASDGRTC